MGSLAFHPSLRMAGYNPSHFPGITENWKRPQEITQSVLVPRWTSYVVMPDRCFLVFKDAAQQHDIPVIIHCLHTLAIRLEIKPGNVWVSLPSLQAQHFPSYHTLKTLQFPSSFPLFIYLKAKDSLHPLSLLISKQTDCSFVNSSHFSLDLWSCWWIPFKFPHCLASSLRAHGQRRHRAAAEIFSTRTRAGLFPDVLQATLFWSSAGQSFL